MLEANSTIHSLFMETGGGGGAGELVTARRCSAPLGASVWGFGGWELGPLQRLQSVQWRAPKMTPQLILL